MNNLTTLKQVLNRANVLREPLDIRDDKTVVEPSIIVNNLICITEGHFDVPDEMLHDKCAKCGQFTVRYYTSQEVCECSVSKKFMVSRHGFLITTIVVHSGSGFNPPEEDYVGEVVEQRVMNAAEEVIKRIVAAKLADAAMCHNEYMMYVEETKKKMRPRYIVVRETRLVERDQNGIEAIVAFDRRPIDFPGTSKKVAIQKFNRLKKVLG